jgi:MerR family transcriptional regulator, copper efflux regulator
MKTGYRIAELATLAGVSPATLRYYEQIGLLPAASRNSSGYRMYDDSAVDRLAFISRAKQLGCSLEEIADLTIAWDGGECGPIQDRLRRLVADKRAAAEVEIAALRTLSDELSSAAQALERHRPIGSCDEECGCLPVVTNAVTTAVTLGRKPMTADDIPIACTLSPHAAKDRVAEWQRLLHGSVSSRSSVASGLHLSFHASVDATELMRLAVAEQDCCRFFSFAITVDHRGVGLDILGPNENLEPIFGVAS